MKSSAGSASATQSLTTTYPHQQTKRRLSSTHGIFSPLLLLPPPPTGRPRSQTNDNDCIILQRYWFAVSLDARARTYARWHAHAHTHSHTRAHTRICFITICKKAGILRRGRVAFIRVTMLNDYAQRASPSLAVIRR